ncbi:MAG: hypothetical protein OXQ31_15205 [Spirochaetaceae bacterium]|nr:hypothetical protein [Spirochaetaceae bacterium]
MGKRGNGLKRTNGSGSPSAVVTAARASSAASPQVVNAYAAALHLALSIMLAMALGRIEAGQREQLHSLTKSA